MMRFTHEAGEGMFVDCAASTIPLNDEARHYVLAQVQVFVSVLGESSAICAEITKSQELIYCTSTHASSVSNKTVREPPSRIMNSPNWPQRLTVELCARRCKVTRDVRNRSVMRISLSWPLLKPMVDHFAPSHQGRKRDRISPDPRTSTTPMIAKMTTTANVRSELAVSRACVR